MLRGTERWFVKTLTDSDAIRGIDARLDAALIGSAEASLHEQLDAWRDWGSHAEALQHLKQLWHVLVHYGLPARLC
jgi:Protein of unknown function (DUF3626)